MGPSCSLHNCDGLIGLMRFSFGVLMCNISALVNYVDQEQ